MATDALLNGRVDTRLCEDSSCDGEIITNKDKPSSLDASTPLKSEMECPDGGSNPQQEYKTDRTDDR